MDRKEYDRQRYLAHREEVLALRREHRMKNRVALLRYARRYYQSHKQESSQASLEYRRTHKTEIKKVSAAYYSVNRDQILKYKKRYHQEHPECSIATRENRRARSKFAGKLVMSVVQEAYERNIKKYGTLTCYLCLVPIEFGQDSLEHKTPLSRGGDHGISNLDVAHCTCNASKNNKTETEYREWQKCLT